MKTQTVLLLLVLLYWAFADAQCPMDLNYVRQLQWDNSSCRSAITDGSDSECCPALMSLFGVGLAQHLKDASRFELPTNASVVSCLKEFQQQLVYLGLSPDWMSTCFKNITSGFISSPLLCAGIETKEDWIRKEGNTSLDSACKGDLSDPTACQTCKNSIDDVMRNLSVKDNITRQLVTRKCYYFTLQYAAGVVNDFGPKSPNTAQCILLLPFVQTASGGRGLAYGFVGAGAALLISALGLL